MFVVGNKVDLVDQANLDIQEATTFANVIWVINVDVNKIQELGAILKLTTAKDYKTIQVREIRELYWWHRDSLIMSVKNISRSLDKRL